MTDTLTVRPSEAAEDLFAMMQLDQPTIMLGQPGIGKSDIGKQVAARYLGTEVKALKTRGKGRNFIDFRATLIDSVDLHGLPVIDKEALVARWVPMGLLPTADDADEGVIFFDEITNADKSVGGALYSLILDRYIGEYDLPKGWRIIAAGNRVEDGAAAQRMGSALANRFNHMTLEPTVDDWINDWALHNDVPPLMVAFFRYRPELLNDFDPARMVNPTSRSWAQVIKILNKGFAPDVERRRIFGAVGQGAATEFMAFIQVWRDLPNVDSVLMNPSSAIVPETSAARYAISGALSSRVREASLDAFTEYMARLPAEFGVMAMRDATARDQNLTMTKAYIDWAADNQDVWL